MLMGLSQSPYFFEDEELMCSRNWEEQLLALAPDFALLIG